jgi:hypothetical protein
MTRRYGVMASTRVSYWKVPYLNVGSNTPYPSPFLGFPPSLLAVTLVFAFLLCLFQYFELFIAVLLSLYTRFS